MSPPAGKGRGKRSSRTGRPRVAARKTEGAPSSPSLARLARLATTRWSWADVRRRWRVWLVRAQARWQTWLAQTRARWRRARPVLAGKLAQAHDRGATVFGRLAFATFRIALIVSAPFLVLVRGAVWLYERATLPAWPALLVAGGGTLLLLTVYGALLSRRLTGRARLGFVAKWIATPIVVGYCGWGLLYLSHVNAKDDAVRSVYTATHPLLRIALSTLILVDRDAVITDLARTPDDYTRMGLPVNQRSLHYRQPDGWVHAVDLRTRPGLKSLVVQWYFDVMGFDTLRHVGTFDHLHVSLPPN